jgi:3-hydroxyisobutyrate dehydrogenase-like beta-hydroxyacid dehydrogenase
VTESPVVGFIGLGDMGGAMARRIIDSGFETVLWARRPDALEPFAAEHVSTAADPADLASRCDVVGVCVWTDDDVRQILEGDRGVFAGCRPGTIIAIHSTILPATCRDLADAAAPLGLVVLDVPVSGGREAALAGTLMVAVGGDEAAAERCRPVFESFGEHIVHVGAVGTALLAKLVNNTLLAANLALADDALTLGEALGIDAPTMAELMRHGSGRSYGLDVALGVRLSPEMRARALVPMHKDLLALTADEQCKVHTDSLLADAAAATVERLQHPPRDWVGADDAS